MTETTTIDPQSKRSQAFKKKPLWEQARLIQDAIKRGHSSPQAVAEALRLSEQTVAATREAYQQLRLQYERGREFSQKPLRDQVNRVKDTIKKGHRSQTALVEALGLPEKTVVFALETARAWGWLNEQDHPEFFPAEHVTHLSPKNQRVIELVPQANQDDPKQYWNQAMIASRVGMAASQVSSTLRRAVREGVISREQFDRVTDTATRLQIAAEWRQRVT
jgi:hypothetical protein